MINKKISLTIMAVLMTGLASASTFGSLQYQQKKATDGEPVEYKIGVINLGENPLNVRFEASGTPNVSLNMEDQITLKSSRILNQPEGRGWYSLGNGSYAKIYDYSFDAAARNFRNRSFTVTVTAATNNSENTAASQKIIQERDYKFSIVNESYEKGLVNFQEDQSQERDRDTEQNRSQNLSIEEKGSRGLEESKEERQNSGQDGIKTSTKFLLAGALVSTAYLVKVMMF